MEEVKLFTIFDVEFVNEQTGQVVTLTATFGSYKELGKYLTDMNKKIMENVECKEKRKLMKLLVFTWILAATLGGCVISLNIQKNNSDSEQKVEQNESANQENDSTMFNFENSKK